MSDKKKGLTSCQNSNIILGSSNKLEFLEVKIRCDEMNERGLKKK